MQKVPSGAKNGYAFRGGNDMSVARRRGGAGRRILRKTVFGEISKKNCGPSACRIMRPGKSTHERRGFRGREDDLDKLGSVQGEKNRLYLAGGQREEEKKSLFVCWGGVGGGGGGLLGGGGGGVFERGGQEGGGGGERGVLFGGGLGEVLLLRKKAKGLHVEVTNWRGEEGLEAVERGGGARGKKRRGGKGSGLRLGSGDSRIFDPVGGAAICGRGREKKRRRGKKICEARCQGKREPDLVSETVMTARRRERGGKIRHR